MATKTSPSPNSNRNNSRRPRSRGYETSHRIGKQAAGFTNPFAKVDSINKGDERLVGLGESPVAAENILADQQQEAKGSKSPNKSGWYNPLDDKKPPEDGRKASSEIGANEENATTSDGQPSRRQVPSDEAALSNDTVGGGFDWSSKGGKVKLSARWNRRRGFAAGGIAGLVVSGGLMLQVGQTQMVVNTAESLTGPQNRISSMISRHMQRRRMSTFSVLVQKKAQKVLVGKTVAKLEKAGFTVVVEKNAIKSISRTAVNGQVDTLVYAGRSHKLILEDIFRLQNRGDEAARAFIKDFDNVAKELLSRSSGVVVRKKLYQKIGLYAFIDWIRASKVLLNNKEPRAPPEALREASKTAERTSQNAAASAGDEAAEAVAREALEEAAGEGVEAAALDLSDEVAEGANELVETIENSGGKAVEVGLEREGSDLLKSSDELTGVLAKGGSISAGDLRRIASSVGGEIGSKVASKSLQVIAGGFDITTVHRQGCRLIGTMDFVKSVRTAFVALELMKLWFKIHTVADHQKAGLIQASSLKIAALYLAGSTSSGAMQWALTGGKVAATSAGISKYGTGFADVGILSAISTFARKIPGLGPDSCRVLANPLTSVAGTVAGGILAVLTFGTVTSVSLGWSLGLTLANEIAFAVAVPLLIRSTANELITFRENDDEKGTIVAFGKGAADEAMGSVNGGLPLKKSLFGQYMQEEDMEYEKYIASQSPYDRYLKPNNGYSLLARASMVMPQSLAQAASTTRLDSVMSAISAIPSTIASGTGLFGSANAQQIYSDQCTDEAVIKYDIATDPGCNIITSYVPLLDIEQTEKILKENNLIADNGDPLGDFADFVENCFSGRTTLLHPEEVSLDGSTDTNDPTCVVGGEKDGTLDGDVPETMIDGATRVPTKVERFAAWYGYLVDEENLISQLNDTEGTDAFGEVSTPQTNNNLLMIGDSLTAGMQNLGGTDPEGDYLSTELTTKGWNPLVNAQGCRGLYQTGGTFTGDGSSCPSGQITDALSVINEQAVLQKIRESDTFVVALGTNRTELGDNGVVSDGLFKQKAEELIDKLKGQNQNATIYWINLRSSPQSTNYTNRNTVLTELASSKGIKVLDWSTEVTKREESADTSDNVGYSDTVHHTADGYRKKVDYLLGALGSPRQAGGASNLLLGADTSDVPCGAGDDLGPSDGYDDGKLYKIKLCLVQGVKVNSQVAKSVDDMFNAARESGIDIVDNTGAFRDMATQRNMWQQRCGVNYPETQKYQRPPCTGAALARPGYSNHQMGFAMDISCDGALINGAYSQAQNNKCWQWLSQNANSFGFYEWGDNEKAGASNGRDSQYYEGWHWSVDGN